jgi:LSU ribosomal protein L15E
MGVYGITLWKSWQQVAEERAARRYPNLEVLGSYWVADDGMYRYFEVIMIDPAAPTVKGDPDYAGIVGRKSRGRWKARRLRQRQRRLVEKLRETLLPKLKGGESK